MRKAARKELDFDLDYDDEAPARSARKPKRARISATRVGIFGLGALSLAIVVNAAFLQDQRRTAPLFKITLAEPETKAVQQNQPQALQPLPPPRIVEAQPQPSAKMLPPETPRATAPTSKVDLIARELSRSDLSVREAARTNASESRAEKPASAEAPKADKHQRAATVRTEPRRKDAIAGLIETSDASASSKAREPAASDVLAAQRALQRLGFVVRPSGIFDSTTRQAIAQFERDRHMPARGQLTPTVKRELARLASGETQ